MGEIFKEMYQDYNAELREFSGESDHVHLLVGNFSFSKNFRFSEDAKISLLQKKIRQEFSQQIRHYLWEHRFWTKLLRDFCGRWSLDTSH